MAAGGLTFRTEGRTMFLKREKPGVVSLFFKKRPSKRQGRIVRVNTSTPSKFQMSIIFPARVVVVNSLFIRV